MRNIFIRFGNIPDNECSGIYQHGDWDEELVGYEKGVSVYDVCPQRTPDDTSYRIVLPYPLSLDNLESLDHLVREAVVNPSFPVLLVSGDVVGKGTDGEPVIKNVKIIGDIKPYLIYEVGREVFKVRKP